LLRPMANEVYTQWVIKTCP